MRIRIILADDHPVVRIGAKAILENSGVGEVIAEASNPDELLDLLAKTACDVLVTDFSMPDGTQPDGLAMIGIIRRRYPDLPILLLSMDTNFGLLRLISESGVQGLVDKASSMDELAIAVQAVHRGSTYTSSKLREIRTETAGNYPSDPNATALTPKETEVVRLLASGMTVTRIAAQLNRSVATISRQKSMAMRKLNVRNDAEFFSLLKEFRKPGQPPEAS